MLRRPRSRWGRLGPEPQAGGKVRDNPRGSGYLDNSPHLGCIASVIVMTLFAPVRVWWGSCVIGMRSTEHEQLKMSFAERSTVSFAEGFVPLCETVVETRSLMQAARE